MSKDLVDSINFFLPEMESTLRDKIIQFKLAFRNKTWDFSITFTHQEIIKEITSLFNQARANLIAGDFNSLMKLLKIFLEYEREVREIHRVGVVVTNSGKRKLLSVNEKVIVKEYQLAYNIFRLQLISDLVRILSDKFRFAYTQIELNFLQAERTVYKTAQICHSYSYFFQTFFLGTDKDLQEQQQLHLEIMEIFQPILDTSHEILLIIQNRKMLLNEILNKTGRVQIGIARPRRLSPNNRIAKLIKLINQRKNN